MRKERARKIQIEHVEAAMIVTGATRSCSNKKKSRGGWVGQLGDTSRKTQVDYFSQNCPSKFSFVLVHISSSKCSSGQSAKLEITK